MSRQFFVDYYGLNFFLGRTADYIKYVNGCGKPSSIRHFHVLKQPCQYVFWKSCLLMSENYVYKWNSTPHIVVCEFWTEPKCGVSKMLVTNLLILHANLI